MLRLVFLVIAGFAAGVAAAPNGAAAQSGCGPSRDGQIINIYGRVIDAIDDGEWFPWMYVLDSATGCRVVFELDDEPCAVGQYARFDNVELDYIDPSAADTGRADYWGLGEGDYYCN